MFLIRRAKPDDSPTLLKLAKMVHFINLPADKEIIDEKIAWSRQCFLMSGEGEPGLRLGSPAARRAQPAPARAAHSNGILAAGLRALTGRAPLFMFVMEDNSAEAGGGAVVGTSQIISKMGGPGAPNVSLQLSRKEMFSESLQQGVTHTVAKIHLDESSPTEIGGLILQPSFRGHRRKLGRFISLVRFHFMALNRSMFSDRVLAEMMGPITSDGHNPFWEHCTRRFINLSYDEADKFCQTSKEFILTLFPRDDIYLTLLSPEARSVVGQVGPETVPARRMLEKLGFQYHNRIDPFDGGPHLEAQLDAVSVVRHTAAAKLADPARADDAAGLSRHGIVSVLREDGEFFAVEVPFDLDRQGRVVVSAGSLAALQAEPGMTAGYTPLDPPIRSEPPAAASAAAPRAPRPSRPTKRPARR